MIYTIDSKFTSTNSVSTIHYVSSLDVDRVSEGRAFAIHDPDIFMEDIASQFFDKQTHLRSFHRQLSIWVSSHCTLVLLFCACSSYLIPYCVQFLKLQGFTRLETGAGGRGVWFHKHFIQDKPEMIKHIKRVPVKNPKPSMSTPKNQLPDYTNYQLPSAAVDHSSSRTANGLHTSTMLPVPVHQPHHNHNVAAAAAAAGLRESTLLSASSKAPPPPSLDYLSTLGRMHPAVPQRYPAAYNSTLLQFPVSSSLPHMAMASDQSRNYPSFMLTNYQPSAVSSMGHFQLPGMSAGNPNVPPANGNDLGLGEVAQQLLACRNNNPPSPTSLGDGNSNLNSALLAMIMDSRRRGTTPASNSGTGLSQELLAAIARRNIYPQAQGPK